MGKASKQSQQSPRVVLNASLNNDFDNMHVNGIQTIIIRIFLHWDIIRRHSI